MKENYLYFAKDGDNDAVNDAIMLPASNCLGVVSLTDTTIGVYFSSLDGDATNDSVSLTIPTSNQEVVIDEYVSLVNRNRNNTNNFTVISDLNDLPFGEGAVSSSGIPNVSSVVINTAGA